MARKSLLSEIDTCIVNKLMQELLNVDRIDHINQLMIMPKEMVKPRLQAKPYC